MSEWAFTHTPIRGKGFAVILPVDERREYFHRFEGVLKRAKLDYEIHMLPGTPQPTDFEEYRVTNLEPPARLFPVMMNGTPENQHALPALVAGALQAHAAESPNLAYYAVLCGTGWSDADAHALAGRLAPPPGIRLTVQTLDQFEALGL